MATLESIALRIDRILSVGALRQLVADNLTRKPEPAFAGTLFDTVGANERDHFGTGDLLTLNLLDEHLGAVAIDTLLGRVFDDALRAVDDEVDLWSANEPQVSAAAALYARIRQLPGVSPTKASKLCARKRPRLIPIYDSVVDRVLGIGGGAYWASL